MCRQHIIRSGKVHCDSARAYVRDCRDVCGFRDDDRVGAQRLHGDGHGRLQKKINYNNYCYRTCSIVAYLLLV